MMHGGIEFEVNTYDVVTTLYLWQSELDIFIFLIVQMHVSVYLIEDIDITKVVSLIWY